MGFNAGCTINEDYCRKKKSNKDDLREGMVVMQDSNQHDTWQQQMGEKDAEITKGGWGVGAE